MKKNFVAKRLPVTFGFVVLLCFLYVFFIYEHNKTISIKNSELSVLAHFEQNWIKWIKDERNKKGNTRFPEVPLDNKGTPLLFPDSLVACAFGVEISSLSEKISNAELALLNIYLFFIPLMSLESEPFPTAHVVWEDLPYNIKKLESSLPSALIYNYISASIAWNLLKIKNRIIPSSSVLLWMRKQATVLLGDGYRREGLALLKLLAPYLSEKDPEFDAWMGSAIIMQALDAVTGMEKIQVVEQGMQILDKAVLKADKNISCFYIRINTYLSLPEFYQAQHEQALKDLDLLVSAFENNNKLTYTNAELTQEQTEVDLEYLIEIVEWAQKNKNISSNFQRSLKKMADRINAVKTKKGNSL
ncbi:hypothetical protein [Gracilinema caldarium]|uniref:hypothetical protein n=1 Tax=Gracilinema caldarium TaxID=215591 RepID=UPI0026EEB846|nr:hypothetical protein [Gracilinema caldarium]